MTTHSSAGYNERLFSSGVKKHLHFARFHWLSKNVKRLNCRYASVIELGAFDGKAIDFLPTKPLRYLGLDANWEHGLDLARERWKGEAGFCFRECHTPQDIQLGMEKFDLAICMDTLEHVPPDDVEPYLAQIAHAARQYCFITVPNEQGGVFAVKYLSKKLVIGDAPSYTFREFFCATLGNMQHVARHEHKGFDYKIFITTVAKYFDIASVSGYPFEWLPLWLNFGIGIIGKVR